MFFIAPASCAFNRVRLFLTERGFSDLLLRIFVLTALLFYVFLQLSTIITERDPEKVIDFRRNSCRACAAQEGFHGIRLQSEKFISLILFTAPAPEGDFPPIGAPTMARAIAFTRVQKHYRNNVNRVVNAEMANQTRSSNAAADQLALIEKAEKLIGLRALPPAVRDFCLARKDNPELSLSALGESFVPPVSKSAMYHRLLRLEKIVQDLEKDA